jgi:hypothetical protein
MKMRAKHQMYQSYAEQKHVLDATKGFVDDYKAGQQAN